MYIYNLPPQKINKRQAKLDFYTEQTDELLSTIHDLCLAYEVALRYSSVDALYFLEMSAWLNSRYDYVMGLSMTFIPSHYEIN